MNTQKGFAPILLILLGVMVIGGGVYYYSNFNQKSGQAIADNKEEIATTTQEQNNPSVIKDENTQSINNLKEARYSFRISPNNPAIVHPVTKAIFSKKINITQEDIGSVGKVVSKDSDSAVIELYGHGCLIPNGYPSVFVYVSENLNDVYGFVFGNNEKEDVTKQVNNIKEYVSLSKNIKEETQIVIQTPPTDIIKDGYYYAKLNDWDEEKKEITVDFLSLLKGEYNNDEPLDVLFQHVEHNAGPTLNILTENLNEKERKVSIIENAIGKEGGTVIENLKQIIKGYDLYFENYQNSPNLLIKIKDEKIIELYQVNTAC